MGLRLVMLGTGQFALPTFRGLYETSHEVVGLVTQPDRTGRGHHQHRNPLKDLAQERGTPVFQPEKASSPESLERLREFRADLFVAAAYGQLLSNEFLAVPRLGAINVHASLLPKYRGAAPIQYALLNGDTETGVTIFQIVRKLDAGPILGMERMAIHPQETYGELEQRLAELAVPLVQRVIDELANGTAQPVTQDEAQATKANRLEKTDGAVPWHTSSHQVCCHIRAVQPWPKPSAVLCKTNGSQVRMLILDAEPRDVDVAGEPGSVSLAEHDRLLVKTGDGAVEVLKLQPDGKRPMSPPEFLRGHPLQPGDRFMLPDTDLT